MENLVLTFAGFVGALAGRYFKEWILQKYERTHTSGAEHAKLDW